MKVFGGADDILFLHLGTGYMGVLKHSLSCTLRMYFKNIFTNIIYNSEKWKHFNIRELVKLNRYILSVDYIIILYDVNLYLLP